MVFIDDILVYFRTRKEYAQHLRFILQILRERQLYVKFSEYKFQLDRVAFFRHMVSVNDISIDLSKIKVVLEWQRYKTTKEVRSFLGLVGYYRQFVKGFTKFAQLFIELTHRDIPFKWLYACEQSFQELKKRLTSTPILALPIEDKEYDLYTDVSHQDLGAVLMSRGQVIAYASHRLNNYQTRYPMHDLELTIVMFALKIW